MRTCRAAWCLALAAALAAGEPADDGPPRETRVSWGGGVIALDEAIALLAAHGNHTELAVGTDGSERAELSLVQGGYWDVLLAVCQAFDLRLQPPERHQRFPGLRHRLEMDDDQQLLAVETGPVVLGRHGGDRVLARQVQGPALIEVVDAGIATTRTVSDHRSRAVIALRVRLEPRYALESLGPGTVSWLEAESSDGRPLALRDPGDPARHGRRFVHWQGGGVSAVATRQREPPTVVQVHDVDPTLRGLRVRGEGRIQLLERARFELLMVPGQRVEAKLGDHGVEVWLLDQRRAQRSEWDRSGLGIAYGRELELGQSPEVLVHRLSGEQVETTGGHRGWSDNRITRYHFVEGLGEDAVYRVSVSASYQSGLFELPIDVEVRL